MDHLPAGWSKARTRSVRRPTRRKAKKIRRQR